MSTRLTSLPTELTKPAQRKPTDPARVLKQGIWVYFLLLIFEGALRKWFLPGLSNLFLFSREPLAIWLVLLSWQRGLLPANSYLYLSNFIGLLSLFTAILAGHGNSLTALYGARVFLLNFPLMFVIGSVFDRKDVLEMGKVTLWISIGMAILITLQFYSPQSAWVNRGIGDNTEGAGFSGALGYFRPPGTFSFITGTTQFFGLATCFIFYFWFQSTRTVNRPVLIAATIGLLAAIPFSISRTLFYQVGVTLFFTVFAVSRKPEYAKKLFIAAAGLVVILILMSTISFFQPAIEAFTARFTGATEYEGGIKGTLVDRYLGGMTNAVASSNDMPFWGYGSGIGTNVGGMLLTGERTILIYGEDEWARLIGELGPFMGITAILLRLALSLKLTLVAYQRLVRGDLLPWLLISFCLLMVPNGQWGQPTSLGFSTLIGGLVVAALRTPERKDEQSG